jgi:solute:Na+ symporter, SSS family
MNHPDKYPAPMISGLQNILGTDWSAKLTLVSYEGTISAERILPAVMMLKVPEGVRGMVLIALIAAAMSVCNALINTATGFFTRDIYQGYIRPKAGNTELIYVSRLACVGIVAAAFVMAYSADNINDIWGWLTMGLTGGLMIPTVLRLYWWRFNGGGFAVGTCFGLVAALLQRMLFKNLVEWQQLVYVTAISLAASVIGTYVTRPTDRKVLENFYIKTRPFGLWGSFRNLLSQEMRDRTKREHINDIISLPFAFFWQVTILLLPLEIGIGAYTAALVTSAILAVSLVGLYFFWYRNLGLIEHEIPMSEPKAAETILN